MISPNTGHIHSSFDMEVMMWWMEAGTRWTYMYMTIYRNVNCDANVYEHSRGACQFLSACFASLVYYRRGN